MGSAGKLERMTAAEAKSAFWLAGIFSLRMLGLFMILPVFVLYATHFEGATPVLAGLAVGIYGLGQALFQIPFGMLSDRFGRKRIIVIGLMLFALGSVVAAMSDTIWGVICGRILQGSGAISAAVMALAADLTREEHRTKVMAIIGMSIGLSFAAAMVIGPIINVWIGVPGIFWLTAILALLGIAVVVWMVPQPMRSRVHRDAEPVAGQFRGVISDPQLVRLNYGIFSLHAILMATFVAVPLALRDVAGLPAAQHWELYLPAMVISLAAVFPLIIVAEKFRRMKAVFLGAIFVLCLTQLGLMKLHDNILEIGTLLVLFFVSFNLLEAALPSLISKTAPPDAKGTALGVYSSSQFVGAFVGGAMGGWMHGSFGLPGVFAFASLVALAWFFLAYTMKSPRYLSSYVLPVGTLSEPDAQRLAWRLTQVQGVAEAVVIAGDGVAYLKVDRHALDETALRTFVIIEA